MNKVFKGIINVILILVIILLACYFALRLTGKIMIYNVETGSMEDKIHAGDYILLWKHDSYKVGDVITYNVDHYFVTHRIITIDDDKIITKGDANNLEDKEIHENQIIGKMIYCGGILNFIIKFKFAIISFLIGLYLLSCYIDKEKNK